jgi:ParB-like chromosome segregation protein Spo0J
VRPNSDGFELIVGARRYRAARLAELFSIPARIVEIDERARREKLHKARVSKFDRILDKAPTCSTQHS